MLKPCLRRRMAGALALAAVTGACASARTGDLEPRYVAIHNALASMGLAEVGSLQTGSLVEGSEARLKVDLPAACTTIVALGTGAARDVDVTLLDADAKPVAHDTTKDPEAVVRACVDVPGSYTLVVKMARGSGDFLVSTWSGAMAAPTGSTSPLGVAAQTGAGTCESPIVLAPGSVSGSTQRGESEQQGSCGSSDAKEIVYRLDLTARERVTLEVDPRFDAVLYVRKDDCADPDAEIACNDDYTGPRSANRTPRPSRVDEVLDPGTYYVFVDGYGNDGGSYHLTTTAAEVPTLADVCRAARPLTAGQTNGSLQGAFDHASASCGDGTPGPDLVYRFDVASRQRTRIVEHTSDFAPAVHVRKACADDSTEVACSTSGGADDEAAFVSILDPGTYFAFADATDRDADGHFTLAMDSAPEQGTGAQGDGCGDAITIPATDNTVTGDTFLARDDLSEKCGGTSAADVVYRFDLPRRSHFSARMTNEEGQHIIAITRACGDKSAEIACGQGSVDDVLAAGSYYLIVDGNEAGDFGKFAMDVKVHDVAAQEAACKGATLISDGQTVNGNTTNGQNRFNTSCGGREDMQNSPDKLYRFVLGKRAKVRVSLSTPSWDGVVVIRKACVDTVAAGGARAAEVACNNDYEDARHARIEQQLDPGTYYILVDGHMSGNEGAFSLEYKVIP